jgi:hypothetical protein
MRLARACNDARSDSTNGVTEQRWCECRYLVGSDARSSLASCTFRLQSLVGLVGENGVVEVHDPRAASDRDRTAGVTSAIGKWKTRFP